MCADPSSQLSTLFCQGMGILFWGLVIGGTVANADPVVKTEAQEPSSYVHFTQDGTFNRNSVIEIAKKLSASPYQAPNAPLPKNLEALSLSQYQNILFQPAKTLWVGSGLPFQMQLLLRGSFFKAPVEIATVQQGHTHHVPFTPDLFTSNTPGISLPNRDIGFSGFSLYYQLNQPGFYNKVVDFQGASYFKAIGKGESWGASARGLAINTADPKGEEFPFFRAFWVEKPSGNSNSMAIDALLDSPSVTGAYRFTIRPGNNTDMDVEVSLFPRKDLSRVGLAPMNSMFLFSGNGPHREDDYRPEVHDSDGLLMVNGKGERLWRPLANPNTLQISAFVDDAPIGFGLMQRDRKFADYQDLKNNYQDKPSLWVEPIGNWGEGSVTLIEIPSDDEIHDNIVSYWAPKTPLKVGSEYDYSYRLHWGASPHPAIGEYIVESTLSGHIKGATNENQRHFVIDYVSSSPDGQPLGSLPVANVVASEGQLQHVKVVKNPHTPGYRLSFDLLPGHAKASELRAELTFRDNRTAETWLYRWTAN